ncbi:listeriolysin S family TOMM bacteriocin [Limosilactobacillus fermentum]
MSVDKSKFNTFDSKTSESKLNYAGGCCCSCSCSCCCG